MLVTVALSPSKGELWERNREGKHGALVVRFANCYLRCHLCYAQDYAYLGGERRMVKAVTLNDFARELAQKGGRAGWIRIQGGEPLMDCENRALATAQLALTGLRWLIEHSPYENPRVVIQTNGIWFGLADEDRITEFVKQLAHGVKEVGRGRIVVEISVKGPNKQDAARYALSLAAEVSAVLELQVAGFEKLAKVVKDVAWAVGVSGLAIYPVACFGPQLERPSFVPVSTLPGYSEHPLFHPDTWSSDFKRVLDLFRRLCRSFDAYQDFVARHGHRVAMEGLCADKFQLGWIGKLATRPELREFARRYVKADWGNRQMRFFEKRYPELRVLIGQASGALLRRVGDLKGDFYDARPREHYPYL